MTEKTHDVSTCRRCGADPRMMEGTKGYAIVCPKAACAKLDGAVVRPRPAQAVNQWNRRQGIPVLTAKTRAPVLVKSADGQVTVSTRAIPTAAPMRLTWRQRMTMRWRRFKLRILWTVSRPGWKACAPCAAEFTVDGAGFVCKRCYLPYADAEAEAMIKAKGSK